MPKMKEDILNQPLERRWDSGKERERGRKRKQHREREKEGEIKGSVEEMVEVREGQMREGKEM